MNQMNLFCPCMELDLWLLQTCFLYYMLLGVLDQLDDQFHLSGVQKGLVVSALPLGTIFGCIFGGPICDKIGRWKTIQIQNLVFVVGALMLSLAPGLNMIYCGRFVIGIASALTAVADVPYLMEVSPVEFRGRLTSSYEILIVLGILCSFVLNLVMVNNLSGWRWMFALPSVFACMQSLGMLTLPESPKWLMKHTEDNIIRLASHAPIVDDSCASDIGIVHSVLFSSHHDDNDTTVIKNGDIRCVSKIQTNGDNLEEKCAPDYRPALSAVAALMFFQQFTGGVVIRNYSSEIFQSAGSSKKDSLWFNILLGVFKVWFTAWAIYKVRKNKYRVPTL